MKVVWVTRSFLDYRIPVYAELNSLLNNELKVVYNSDYVPDRVHSKIQTILGDNACGLSGEFRVGPNDFGDFLANKKIRICCQPDLIKTIKALNPDIIISDGFFQWTYAALWLRAFGRIPHLMCYERTLHTERNAQWFRKLYRKVASKFIDGYCASGKLCGDYLRSLGVDSSKISFGHMAADTSGISRLHTVKSDRRYVTYLYVGKLIERKGIKQLLDAWYSFQKSRAERVVLKIVGDGDLLDYVKTFLVEKGLKNVQLLGHLDYDQMYRVYKLADVFLMPTLEDNWSLVVPEAMANELPVLCSIYNGCWPEYVTTDNGWVFDPLDNKDFVEKLEASFRPEVLEKMGQVSRRLIQSHTPIQAARSLFSTVRNILENT